MKNILTFDDLTDIIQNKPDSYFERKSFANNIIYEKDIDRLIYVYGADYRYSIMKVLALYARTAKTIFTSNTIMYFIMSDLNVFYRMYCKKEPGRNTVKLSQAQVLILPVEYTRIFIKNRVSIPRGIVLDVSEMNSFDIVSNLTLSIIKSNTKLDFVSPRNGNSVLEQYYLPYIKYSYTFIARLLLDSDLDHILSYTLFKYIFDTDEFTDEQKTALASTIRSRTKLDGYTDTNDFRFSKTFLSYIVKYSGKINIGETDAAILKKYLIRGVSSDSIEGYFNIKGPGVLFKASNLDDSAIIRILQANPDFLSFISPSLLNAMFNRPGVFRIFGELAFKTYLKTGIRTLIPGDMVKYFDNGMIDITATANIDVDAICLLKELNDGK